MSDILEFWGDYRFLSNFYPAEFVWDGILWPTAEHAYQAAKVLDRAERIKISKLSTPGAAKKYGKHVSLREDWEDVKYAIMYDVVCAKFKQNPDLMARLKNTGNAYLEEGNTWNDRIWGICPPGSGKGLNWLGEILMNIRESEK